MLCRVHDFIAESDRLSDPKKPVKRKPADREAFSEWVKSNDDASKFFREIGEHFGKVEFMEASIDEPNEREK